MDLSHKDAISLINNNSSGYNLFREQASMYDLIYLKMNKITALVKSTSLLFELSSQV